MTLGEIIYLYRTENGISQRKFADMCGNRVTHGYISMLEKNRNPNNGKPLAPSIEVYKSVAEAMRISLDELLQKLNGDESVTVIISNDRDDAEWTAIDPATQAQIAEIDRLAAQMTPEQRMEATRYLEFLLSKK